MMPCAASIAACARDWATSYGARRQSNPSERFSAWKTGSGPCAKRDTAGDSRPCPSGREGPELGDLRAQAEAEQIERDAPARVGVARLRVPARLGVAPGRPGDGQQEGQTDRH